MSYILEALRKSEQERQRGAAPTLRSAPAVVLAPKKPPATALLVGALLLIAGGIAIGVLRPWQSAAPARATEELPPAPRETRPLPPAPAPPQPAGDRVAETTSPERESGAAASPTVSGTPTAPVTKAIAPPRDNARSNHDAVAARPPEPRLGESPNRPAASTNASAAIPATATPPAAATPAAQSAPSPVAPASEPATTNSPAAAPVPAPPRDAAADQHLPVLAELPPELRQQLPALALSVHFYSPQPERSLVSINGQSLHEGDPISDELKLERITPSGVVLNYRGNRFQLGAQTWSR